MSLKLVLSTLTIASYFQAVRSHMFGQFIPLNLNSLCLLRHFILAESRQ